LEEKADRLYRYIYDYLTEHARPPSHREMAVHMGMSTKTLPLVLATLEKQGRAIYRRRKWRHVWPREEG
jgi:DNA-binding transcriptional regulator YhcF (GntR family)